MHRCYGSTAGRGRLQFGLRGGKDAVDEFIRASVRIRDRPQSMLALYTHSHGRVCVCRGDRRRNQGRTLLDRERELLRRVLPSPSDIRPPDASGPRPCFPAGIFARTTKRVLPRERLRRRADRTHGSRGDGGRCPNLLSRRAVRKKRTHWQRQLYPADVDGCSRGIAGTAPCHASAAAQPRGLLQNIAPAPGCVRSR